MAGNAERTKSIMNEKMLRSTVLKQHYCTPAECLIPALRPKNDVHRAVYVQPGARRPNNQENEEEPVRRELDGFYLLEATGMGFPEDAQQALLADKKLVAVNEDDMSYFTEMLYIDASENALELAPFGVFPRLRELKLACNHITGIDQELFGFENLTCLDLSYNRLTCESVQALEVLPNLKDLDLSGNKLQELPDDWQHYRSLEKLLLDYNMLESNDIFTSISSAPNLRYLSVYDNHLSVFPDVALACEGFRVLDTLDLACNYFNEEKDIEPSTRLPRIQTIKLYGNRIFGESGEDPMYIYIEGLVDDAIAYREATAPHMPNIDFVTEFPKPKNMKKGQPLGRQANYRDFAIVQVESATVQTNRSWREHGNQTIFAETMGQKRRNKLALEGGLSTAPSTASLPDMTFLTSSHAITPSGALVSAGEHGAHAAHGAHGHGHGHHGHGKSHDVVADDVMQRVAGDMGLISSAEMLILQDRVQVNSSVLRYLQEDADEDSDDDFDIHGMLGSAGADGEDRTAPTAEERRQRLNRRLQQKEEARLQDQVPGGLFREPMMADATVLAPQPVALKTAMKALQQALTQPLTDYDELPSKSIMFPSKDYYKPTRSSVLRQMPRHTIGTNIYTTEEEYNSDDDKAEEALYNTGNGTLPSPNRAKVSAGAVRAASGAASVGGESAVGSVRTAGTGVGSSKIGSKTGTAATKAGASQQGPRAPTAGRKPGSGAVDPDLPANRYVHRGLRESNTVKRMRQEQREHTLGQIEEVLQGLNSHTTGWSERQALQGINSVHNRGHQAKSEKETMREMRDFAQPFTGVKSLLNMVADIEEEFNS